MNVVIVESPAKAKTINKYLGSNFKVLASYGHIRDLPSKEGSVDPEHDFAMIWDTPKESQKHIKEIVTAVKDADAIYLATDPDREGEAIAWHVLEVLKEKKALKKTPVHRVVFHEITKKAILDAVAHPREVNQELVHAYLARRALDYLVGFSLSPVLWRKLPGSRSAGRVQSVALRLIAEREGEIEKFISQEYWTIAGLFENTKKESVFAKLTILDGEKLDKFSIPNEDAAKKAKEKIEAQQFSVASIQKKQVKRSPQPAFTTSTLQQEASRKLGFTTRKTMQIAQKLYEGVEINGETMGLITYMRTDSVNIGNEALEGARKCIDATYGKTYLPDQPRFYKNKAKNAQEAHEAIRPTSFDYPPQKLDHILDKDQLKLYTLIWRRTIASQMQDALLDQVGIDITSADKKITLRATGSTIAFDGFLKVYEEGNDDAPDAEDEKRIPPLKEGESMDAKEVKPEQHFTLPPPRFTEASLVKRLEELGIGRPSTYSSIINVLQDRDYVHMEGKAFVPDSRGRLVTTFLENYFGKYVEYNFTADMENQLDEIAEGKHKWQKTMKDFWKPFETTVTETKKLKNSDVLDVLDAALADHFFPHPEGALDPRICPKCKSPLHLKLGRYGAFIGCTNYPECTYIQKIKSVGDDSEVTAEPTDGEYPKALGVDKATGLEITLRKGPYGFYVQLGEGDKKEKPKRASLPKGTTPQDMTLDRAETLLSLPRILGTHPETGEQVSVGIGRFGPYIKHGKGFTSLKKHDIFSINLNEAIEVLNSTPKKSEKS